MRAGALLRMTNEALLQMTNQRTLSMNTSRNDTPNEYIMKQHSEEATLQHEPYRSITPNETHTEATLRHNIP